MGRWEALRFQADAAAQLRVGLVQQLAGVKLQRRHRAAQAQGDAAVRRMQFGAAGLPLGHDQAVVVASRYCELRVIRRLADLAALAKIEWRRCDLPGVPHHVVQRGHERLPCFAGEVDYVRYRRELQEAALRHGCAIHACVLMTNHVHLLVSPASEGAVSRMMQMLGCRYMGEFNARYRRSGTLWEGRFKSCLVDSEQYLLRCYRYIELNPVRARMVAAPGSYSWSSYTVNAEGHADRLVTPHAAWLALDVDPASRGKRYAAWVSEGVDAVETEEIRAHLVQRKVYGSQRFRRHIESLAGQCTEVRPRGGPCLIQRE